MCLFGNDPSPPPASTMPPKKVWDSEYEPAPDTVNNKLLSDTGDYSQEATKDLTPKKAKLKTPTKQSEKRMA